MSGGIVYTCCQWENEREVKDHNVFVVVKTCDSSEGKGFSTFVDLRKVNEK
jgi:hypothetical protein